MSEPEIIAEFNDYPSLIIALRRAKDRREISYVMLDHLANAPDHLSSKILGPSPQRALGPTSFGQMFFGLGVKCLLVDDHDVLKLQAKQISKRDQRAVRIGGVQMYVSFKFMREISKLAAAARMRNASRKKRRIESARHAALVRWKDIKEAVRNGSSR